MRKLRETEREVLTSMLLMIFCPVAILLFYWLFSHIFESTPEETVNRAIKAGTATKKQVSVVCVDEEPYIREQDGKYIKPQLLGNSYIRSLCTK